MKIHALKYATLASALFLVACGGSDSGDESEDGSGGGNTPVSYTISTQVNGNGTISPTSQSVQSGNTTSFTITPAEHYEISSVSGCSGSLSDNIYTTGNITSNCTVTADFSEIEYEISASTTGPGQVEPATKRVLAGEQVTFQLIPDDGAIVSSASGCDGSLSGNTYITGAITESCSVEASFNLNTYTVTATAGEGGSISPGSAAVTHGESTSFTISTDTGYSIANVSGCDGSLSGNTYITGAITESCSVEASFNLNTYTVTATAGEGGSISPGSATVTHGESTSFTISTDTGYSIANVSGCDGSLSGNTYTTGAITESCSVEALFSVNINPPEFSHIEIVGDTLRLSWELIDNAETYHVFYGPDPDITPDNFSRSHLGEWVQSVEPPLSISQLERDTDYYFVVVSVIGSAESEPSASIRGRLESPFEFAGGLNDTGMTWCANDFESELECPVEGFEGQDAEFGRDSNYPELSKVGSGSAGFDWTKIDANGISLSQDSDQSWQCVRDNVTGLMWERSPASAIENPGLLERFSWYDSSSPWPGVKDGGSCSIESCDTEGYIKHANENQLCGHSDWRLPSVQEFVSILKLDEAGTMLDKHAFPWARSPANFWTQSQSVETSSQAFIFDLNRARNRVQAKSSTYPLLLVRDAKEQKD